MEVVAKNVFFRGLQVATGDFRLESQGFLAQWSRCPIATGEHWTLRRRFNKECSAASTVKAGTHSAGQINYFYAGYFTTIYCPIFTGWIRRDDRVNVHHVTAICAVLEAKRKNEALSAQVRAEERGLISKSTTMMDQNTSTETTLLQHRSNVLKG